MYIFLFVLWTVFWSFWSVLITRFNEWISLKKIKWFLFWKSKCPKCWKKLKYYDLIPIISFFLLKWKCRYCWKKINIIYPILEVFSGLIFIITWFVWKKYWLNVSEIIFWIYTNWLFWLLVVYDFWKMELSNISFFLLIPSFFYWLYISSDVKNYLFLSFLLFIVFLFIYFFSKIYAKKKYDMDEWFWFWDVIFSPIIWALFFFIFRYNYIEISYFSIFEVFIYFMIVSSLLWIFIFFVQKIKKGWHNSNVLAFIPSMVFSYWLLLLFFGLFIKFL